MPSSLHFQQLIMLFPFWKIFQNSREIERQCERKIDREKKVERKRHREKQHEEEDNDVYALTERGGEIDRE